MNNKIGKTLLSTLSVAVLSLSSSTVILANNEIAPLPTAQTIKTDAEQAQVKPSSHYISVKGTIKEITDYGQTKGMQLVTVTTANGDITRFVVSDETYLLDELTAGSEIIAFYDANVPVILIYPPQYNAIAIAIADNGRTVKVDHFDENLISADGSLKLNITDETNIILKDGSPYDGDLTNQDLIVSYGPSTRSIPAQTTPEQIIVLSGSDTPSLDDEGDQDQVKDSFTSITGTIQDITEFAQGDSINNQLITIETKDSELIHVVVSDNTYIDEKMTTGAEIVAFYNSNAPMLMIYPPRYNAEAIALVNNDRSVMVDRFDEKLLNSEQSLKLTITEATEVLTQDGKAFEGDLTNRKLFVEYQVVALSYPGQTVPTRIVVLDDQDASAIEENNNLNGIENKQWLINGKSIVAPNAYLNEQGTVMVPLRAVAEALGYELTWESETMTIRAGKAISLQIGQDNYLFARMAPIQLGTAPQLVDGLTYVPLSFFKEVIRAEEIRIDADQIVIQE